jgi:transposase
MIDQDIQPAAGYASPPENHQFKKGKSGNPKGRPKKKVDEFTILQRVLKRKVNIKGEDRKIPISAALIHKLLELALSGDRRALDRQRRILSEAASKDDGIDLEETRDRFLKFFENRGVEVNYEGSRDD